MNDWERIVSQNARDVFRVALRMLGSEHDAEDVAQDVFYEALGLAGSREIRDWSGLLRRLAALRSLDRLRRRRETAVLDVDSPIDADPSHDAVAKELADRLREAICRLSEQQAVVFSLAYFEAYSRDQIAESLEISPMAVSTALYKARQKLKSLLAETSQEISDG